MEQQVEEDKADFPFPSDFADGPPVDVTPPKKKRGRPKGSKNKKVSFADVKELPPIPEEPVEPKSVQWRANHIRMINRYFQHFGEKISLPKPKNVHKFTDDQLAELIAQIELDLGSEGAMDYLTAAYSSGMYGLEKLHYAWNPLKLDLRNLGAIADSPVQRKTWEELLLEFSIKHDSWLSVGIEKRLIVYTANLVMTVNSFNKRQMYAAMSQQVSPEDEESFNEL